MLRTKALDTNELDDEYVDNSRYSGGIEFFIIMWSVVTGLRIWAFSRDYEQDGAMASA